MIAERAARLLIDRTRARYEGASPQQLCRLGAALVEAHPTMALLHNLRATIDALVRGGRGLSSDARRLEFVDGLHQWLTALVDARTALAACAAVVVPTRRPLLLLSHSGTVLAVCRALGRRRDLRVVVCESRPVCEGVAMARALAQAGCDGTVIADAACGSWITRCGAVLLGADWVDRRGFVNKSGSRALSVLAVAAGVPVFILADRARIRPRILSAARLPAHNPRQILTTQIPGFTVDNRPFERVEWMSSHRLITDSGHFPRPAEQWSEIVRFRPAATRARAAPNI